MILHRIGYHKKDIQYSDPNTPNGYVPSMGLRSYWAFIGRPPSDYELRATSRGLTQNQALSASKVEFGEKRHSLGVESLYRKPVVIFTVNF